MSYSNQQSSSHERPKKVLEEIMLRSATVKSGRRLGDAVSYRLQLDEPERPKIIPPVRHEVSVESELVPETAPQTNVVRFPLGHEVEQAAHTVFSSDAEARISDARQKIEDLNAAA